MRRAFTIQLAPRSMKPSNFYWHLWCLKCGGFVGSSGARVQILTSTYSWTSQHEAQSAATAINCGPPGHKPVAKRGRARKTATGKVRGTVTETVEVTVGGQTVKVPFNSGDTAEDLQAVLRDAIGRVRPTE